MSPLLHLLCKSNSWFLCGLQYWAGVDGIEGCFPFIDASQRIEIDLCVLKLEFYNFLAVVNIKVTAEISF